MTENGAVAEGPLSTAQHPIADSPQTAQKLPLQSDQSNFSKPPSLRHKVATMVKYKQSVRYRPSCGRSRLANSMSAFCSQYRQYQGRSLLLKVDVRRVPFDLHIAIGLEKGDGLEFDKVITQPSI
jgi:hypothetical protein